MSYRFLYNCFLDDDGSLNEKEQWPDKKLNISYKDILWPESVGSLCWSSRIKENNSKYAGCAPSLGDPTLALKFWIYLEIQEQSNLTVDMWACVEGRVSTHHSEVLLITKTTEKADTDISKGISFTSV